MALGNPDTDDTGLGQYLAPKTLSLIRPDRVAVLTGDEPVCWWSHRDGPVGFATAQVVRVPLARNLILQFGEPTVALTDLGLPDISTPEAHDQMALFVNELVASQAERWIVHHPDDQPLQGLSVPPRNVWRDQFIDVTEEDGLRREVYVHRAGSPTKADGTRWPGLQDRVLTSPDKWSVCTAGRSEVQPLSRGLWAPPGGYATHHVRQPKRVRL